MVDRSFGVSGLAAAICCALFLLVLSHASKAEADQASITQSGMELQLAESGSHKAEPVKSTVHLKVGWINMPPFQRPLAGKLSGVEGLDVDILTKITNALKIEVNLKERSWNEQLHALENLSLIHI